MIYFVEIYRLSKTEYLILNDSELWDVVQEGQLNQYWQESVDAALKNTKFYNHRIDLVGQMGELEE